MVLVLADKGFISLDVEYTEIIMETYGVPPSRVIGEIKEIIKEAILEGEIPNDYEAAYALMERLAEERGLWKKQ